MKKTVSSLFAIAMALGAASAAQATPLLTLINPVSSTPTTYSLSFVATGTSSVLSDGGYQLPRFTQFTSNSVVALTGGPNLLSQVWAFTPAASGSDTSQYSDGTSVNALNFGGVTEGSYDVYSQIIATTPGASYVYSFTISPFAGNPDGFFVDVTNIVTGAVPEPATWAMMLAGFGMIGFAARRRSSVKTAVSFA